MTRRRDTAEAVTNAAVGLVVSVALVEALRRLGAWDAPAAVVAAIFFGASTARAYVLRRVFRAAESTKERSW